MSMKIKPRKKNTDNGFEEWGGYMEAKKQKLVEQFQDGQKNPESDLFRGIGIMVNGHTHPNADTLKTLMTRHGGAYHVYRSPTTTHVIASNLPNTKIKNLGNLPIVKPQWITDSINLNKVIDYKRYLLYTNQSVTQPKLQFQMVKPGPEPEPEPPDTRDVNELEVPPPNRTGDYKKLPNYSNKSAKTASDPSFLREFYNNSRLHLISTMSAEFKQLVRDLREESDGVFPGRLKLTKQSLPRDNNYRDSVVIMHIDMDCFFVSVGLRTRPHLLGRPVVVTHGNPDHRRSTPVVDNLEHPHHAGDDLDLKRSTSEIACASYEARKFGIKNGMWLGSALKLCPGLEAIHYDFQAYKDVAKILYETIASYTLDIEAVSCDEMYVDVTRVLDETGLSVSEWATHIRKEVEEKTGCPCSSGFGSNRLQARLATKKAKPAGQFHIALDEVEIFMREVPVSEIPGVGYSTCRKLKNLGLITCGDIQTSSLQLLQAELGQKAGETLFHQARGTDNRPLNFEHERKTVSTEVNYGIRFQSKQEAIDFLRRLSDEVWSRLAATKMSSRFVTLKLMVRSAEAPVETTKYLGHGACDSVSRSRRANNCFDDSTAIFREVRAIYDSMGLPYNDLRGVGIHLTKLEKRNNAPKTTLFDFYKESKVKTDACSSKTVERSAPVKGEIDLDTLMELPEEIRKEIMIEYNLEEVVGSKTDSSGCNEELGPSATLKEGNSRNKRNELMKEKSERLPFHELSLDELRKAFESWVSTETAPANVDVHLLAEYLKELVAFQELERLKILFSFFHRTFSGRNCSWHRTYYQLLELVQEQMVLHYGARLMIRRSFNCC